MTLTNAIAARIAAARRHLEAGGLLQSVEVYKPGPRDDRGRRQRVLVGTFQALINDEPALERGSTATERADNIYLVFLEAVEIDIEYSLVFSGSSHAFKKLDGLVKDGATGERYISEVTVIR